MPGFLVPVPIPNFRSQAANFEAKAIFVLLDFTAGTTVLVDLLLQLQKAFIDDIRTLFIDNSLNGSTVAVSVQTTNQTFTIPKNSCGFFPLFSVKPMKYTFVSAGAVKVSAQLLNIDYQPMVWSV